MSPTFLKSGKSSVRKLPKLEDSIMLSGDDDVQSTRMDNNG